MCALEDPATSGSVVTANPPASRLRRALLVLGMHRSGTSALTRVLSLLGADLPVRLMPPVANDNARGFWEPEGVARLHDEMLTAVDSSWDDFLPMPEHWHELAAVRAHLGKMLALLRDEFADSTLFVLKDPRICRCVPMWMEMLDQFGAAPGCVITLRNPLEVAASLQARNGFPVDKSLAIWLRYSLDAELSTRGQPRTFVSYQHLLRDWRSVTDKIAADLKFSWPRCHYRASLEIDEFLSTNERHHAISDDEFEKNSIPSPWVKKAYFALRRMVEGALEEGAAALDAVRGEVAVAERSYGVIVADYRRNLKAAHNKLEQARSEAERDRSESQRNAEQLQATIEQSRTSAEELKGRLEEVQTRCEQLQSQSEQLQSKSEQLEKCLAEARSHSEHLEQRLGESQSQSAQLRSQLEQVQSDSAQLQAQVEQYRKEVDARDSELLATRQAFREKTAQSEQLRRDVSERKAEILELHCEKESLENDLKQARDELDAQRSRLAGRDQQLAAKDRELARLQQELRAREKELATERAQSASLERERARGDQALARWTGMAISVRESSKTVGAALGQASEGHSVRGLARKAYRQFGSRTRLLLRRRGASQRRERVLASGLFDACYYLLHNADVLSAGVDPLDHFLLVGGKEGRNPCALFDAEYYLRTNGDVAAAGVNPLDHYLLSGATEQRKPCPLFDTGYYLRENPDVAQGGQNPLAHYLRFGAEEGRWPHPLFHTDYYLRENSDVRVLRVNPLEHYLDHGAAEGRRPNPLFDTDYYLREYPDVAAAKTNPLVHYVEFGAAQGRKPNPLFDTAFYLGENADVAASGTNPLEHYLQRGGKEGRRPSPGFDVAAYLKQNPDVAASGTNPLTHYFQHVAQDGYPVVAATAQGTVPADSMALPSVDVPLVSIIVPVHNRWPATLQCLRSIQGNTGGLPYEVILADDGSTDETAKAAAAIANLTVAICAPNAGEQGSSGLVRNCNQAARWAQGKYLVFLSPDALVQSGWLQAMVDLAERDETAGIIGPKLLSPDGLLGEAGRIVWNDASDVKYGAGDDPHRPEYSHVRQSDYVSSAALLVRRSLFEQVGGFDERFSPSGLEDADLAFKCRRQGCKVLYQPKAVVIHREAEAAKDADQVAHRLYFEQKWSQVLKEEHLPPGTHLFLARNHSRSAQHLLYCDWDVPDADRDSGSFRACNLMQILIEMGYRLTFLPANLYPAEPQVDRLRQMGIFAACGSGFSSLEDFFTRYGGYFDAVIVSRVNVAEQCMELVRTYCHKAYRVFDTTDLHFLREQREAEVADDDALRAKAAATRKKELGFIQQSDVTLVVSAVEKELLRKEAPQARVEIVSNIHPIHSSARPFLDRKDMLFIGGFNHRPNPDAVKWLAKDIFPRIRERLPGVNLYVIGSHPPVDVLALNSDDFRVLGYVADIEPYFDQCRLSVVPLRYGAGVKGKINMSMSYGLPVVSTTVGCEGMFLSDGADVLIADDAQAFADAVCRLYTDGALWQRLSAGGLKNVERYFSFEAARQALDEIFARPSAASRGLARAA